MDIAKKSLGMLIDEAIVDLIQDRAPDETYCASDHTQMLFELFLEEIEGDALKMALPEIIKLTIEHTMIYFNRRFLLYSELRTEALDAARRVNEINTNRVNLVRMIDKRIDSEYLSFSPKTYGQGATLVRNRSAGVLVDDLISSVIKFQIDRDAELSERVKLLSDFLQNNLAGQTRVFSLIELCVAATMCFYAQEVLSHSKVDSEAIKAAREIAVANGLRKAAIKEIDRSNP